MDAQKLIKWAQIETVVSKVKALIKKVVGTVPAAVGETAVKNVVEYINAMVAKAQGDTTAVEARVKAIEDAKGAAGGFAELDENGLVPSSQLPSYVDDVLEYENAEAFPETGEAGKIYVALDTNLTYRWTGTQYTEISKSLAIGETSSTAYAGDKGKKNAEDIALLNGTVEQTGSVKEQIATESTALKNGVIKTAQDAADAAQDSADEANDAIAILNGDAETEGSVAKAVAGGVADANSYTDTELAKFTYATDEDVNGLFPELAEETGENA